MGTLYFQKTDFSFRKNIDFYICRKTSWNAIFSLNNRPKRARSESKRVGLQNLEALGRIMEGYKKPNPKDI